MKTLMHVVVGAVAGFALGFLSPIALYFLLLWADPAGQQGVGTVFALLTFLTAPAGAFAGAYWGYLRCHPEPKLVKLGPWEQLNAFDEHFGGYSSEDQFQAMEQVLPSWLEEYRTGMRPRFVVVSLLTVASISMPFLLVFVLGYFMRTGKRVFEMRSMLQSIRERWGDAIIAGVRPLPLTLRTRSPERATKPQ